MIKIGPETHLERMVEIGPVTIEIWTWTYVARSNVAWTRVIVIVDIYQRWSQKANIEIWSK